MHASLHATPMTANAMRPLRLLVSALALVLAFGPAACAPDAGPEGPTSVADAGDVSRWQARAERVEIMRDEWGVPHIYAPTDADAVFAEFGSALGLDDRTLDDMRRRFVARLFPGEPDPFARVSAIRHPLPESDELLVVHDPDDRRVSSREAARLLDAHPGARLLRAPGTGHTRILRDDAVLDALVAFVDGAERTDTVGRMVADDLPDTDGRAAGSASGAQASDRAATTSA